MPTLHGLRQSPFTHRAKWALRFHGVEFKYHEHILVGDGVREVDSVDIARWAEKNSQTGKKLFPDSKVAEINQWIQFSDRLLNADRAMFCVRTLRSGPALLESSPWKNPAFMRPVYQGLTAFGIAYIGWAYGIKAAREKEYLADLLKLLDEVNAKLGSQKFLLGDLTYADVAVGSAFGMLDSDLMPEVRGKYSHLIEWARGIKKLCVA